jgi:hypothetical protein
MIVEMPSHLSLSNKSRVESSSLPSAALVEESLLYIPWTNKGSSLFSLVDHWIYCLVFFS